MLMAARPERSTGTLTFTQTRRERDVKAHVGDRIVVESERVAQPGRAGVIQEVIQEEPPRYLVQWEDGRTSTFSPAAGAAKIEQQTKAS